MSLSKQNPHKIVRNSVESSLKFQGKVRLGLKHVLCYFSISCQKTGLEDIIISEVFLHSSYLDN